MIDALALRENHVHGFVKLGNKAIAGMVVEISDVEVGGKFGVKCRNNGSLRETSNDGLAPGLFLVTRDSVRVSIGVRA